MRIVAGATSTLVAERSDTAHWNSRRMATGRFGRGFGGGHHPRAGGHQRGEQLDAEIDNRVPSIITVTSVTLRAYRP